MKPILITLGSLLAGGFTQAAPLVLNEILADNQSSVENGGSRPDYIELRNAGAEPFDLTGVSLSDDPAVPAKFVFPAGMELAGDERMIVWCDGDLAAPGLHTGFGLSSAGETVRLMDGAVLLDSVTFGPQAPDVAIGRVADGTGPWTAVAPSPLMENSALTLGDPNLLKVNEWMANPASGDDWFELYNPGSLPVALGGLVLTDSSFSFNTIAPLSFIAAGGYTEFIADGSIADRGVGVENRCAFRLSSGGETLYLNNVSNTATINFATFGVQTEGVSQGRFPDGGAVISSFPITASPEKPNWLPAVVVVNEALANTPGESGDFIELHNPASETVDIGGWWLSDDTRSPKKYQFPASTPIPAGGYLLISGDQLAAGDVPFSLSSRGEQVCLAQADGGGLLTGYRAQVSFGSSLEGVSFGRVVATGLPNGEAGAEFWPQQIATPGAPNGAPRTTPVIINEIMYHPVDGIGGADVTLTEFIELHNPTSAEVDLAGWVIKGGSDFQFPPGAVLPPSGYLLVVSFNPSNATLLNQFRASYGLGAGTVIVGPLSSPLANSSQEIEVARPADFDGLPGLVNVDKTVYRDSLPWPLGPDGGGSSLQRLSRTEIGNTASNWPAAAPTPGAVNRGLYSTLQVWTESPLPTADTSAVYSFALTAVGGTAPYTWSLGSGELPAGITLSPEGVFSGTPENPGSHEFTVALGDSAAGAAEAAFTLTVTGADPDSDADGMPDSWETDNGLIVGVDDSGDDADHDGQSNLDEFQAGTDPQDSASKFAILSVEDATDGSITITWSAVSGKSYQVWSSPDLSSWGDPSVVLEAVNEGTLDFTTARTGDRGFLQVRVVIGETAAPAAAPPLPAAGP